MQSAAGVCEYKGIAYDEGESYGTEMGCGERGEKQLSSIHLIRILEFGFSAVFGAQFSAGFA